MGNEKVRGEMFIHISGMIKTVMNADANKMTTQEHRLWESLRYKSYDLLMYYSELTKK